MAVEVKKDPDDPKKIDELIIKLDNIQALLSDLRRDGFEIKQDLLQAIDEEKEQIIKKYINHLND